MAADFIEGQRITTQYADPTKDRTGVISSVDTTDHITIKWDYGKQDNISYSYGTAHRAFKVVDDDVPSHVTDPRRGGGSRVSGVPPLALVVEMALAMFGHPLFK